MLLRNIRQQSGKIVIEYECAFVLWIVNPARPRIAMARRAGPRLKWRRPTARVWVSRATGRVLGL